MPLSNQEIDRLRADHWDPAKSAAAFSESIERWCEDYGSIREGLLVLLARIEEDRVKEDPPTPTYATLRRYADGTVRDPIMGGTGILVLRSIYKA